MAAALSPVTSLLKLTLTSLRQKWRHLLAKQAGGYGISQILIANELDPCSAKPLIRSLIGIRVITLKVIVGGGAVGQEGPTLQITSELFYRIGEKATKWIQQISENEQ